MKRLLIVAAIAVIAAPALAGSEVLPIDGVGYLRYDVATGQVTPVTAETRRLGPPIWEASYNYVNFFWGADPFAGEAGLDWADVETGVAVGGFGFSEFTNSQAGDGDLYAVILFYQEENGEDSGREYVIGYLIDNIPGSTHPPNEYWGYIWGVDLLGGNFILDGSDLDGDNLTDWGYFQFFSGQTPACAHGPGIAGLLASPPWDPNNTPPECPGVEDAFCLYQVPAWNNGPNNIDPNNLGASVGCNYWFGGPPVFSQFHFVLYAPVCPNRGESGRYCQADIDGSFDCIVSLADLAQLLGNYGCDSGDPNDPNYVDICSLLMGDVDPYDEWWPGDGVIGLGDLAELLSQYGDDCTEP